MEPLREKIKHLPELPVEAFEVAGKLGFSEKMPGITIRPHKFRAPKKPTKQSATLIPNKSQYSIRKYVVWVTYPRVVNLHLMSKLIRGVYSKRKRKKIKMNHIYLNLISKVFQRKCGTTSFLS
jgi:hypothetical protein